MVANRQDAWTPDDDLLLAEVTLRHIREGGTQLKAFEEVAEKLGRTSAACGFRWNSTVRKNYETAIGLAKSHRKKSKSHNKNSSKQDQEESIANTATSQDPPPTMGITIDQVIEFLILQRDQVNEFKLRMEQLEKELEEQKRENEQLRQENERMKNDYFSAKTVNEDYRALVQIMERARKLAFLNEGEDPPKFNIDLSESQNRTNK